MRALHVGCQWSLVAVIGAGVASCSPAQPASPAQPPASAREAPAPAMDHSTMPMGMPAADAVEQAVDPVCGLSVDAQLAPQATHEDRLYSFCSEQHRDLFQKNPAKYLPK